MHLPLTFFEKFSDFLPNVLSINIFNNYFHTFNIYSELFFKNFICKISKSNLFQISPNKWSTILNRHLVDIEIMSVVSTLTFLLNNYNTHQLSVVDIHLGPFYGLGSHFKCSLTKTPNDTWHNLLSHSVHDSLAILLIPSREIGVIIS